MGPIQHRETTLRLPRPAFLRDPALAFILTALPRARLVGGCVRDALAQIPSADIDLATPDHPDAIAAALQAAGLKSVPTGIDHGTITAIVSNRPFEITTLRRDIETDGRHATIAFTNDWQQDAARRDFTINAMSITRDGLVHDYFGGIADLHAGLVRFVGNAPDRVAEDYLRILRFFRFHARYGIGAPDPHATEAIRAGIHGLARLSVERIWSELKRILAAPDPTGAIRLMASLGVLPAILPEGADPGALATLVADGAPADPLLRLAALFTGNASTLADRLRLSLAERDRLLALRDLTLPADDATDDDLRRALADTPAHTLIGRAWLARRSTRLRERLAATPAPVFPLQGRDLLAAGLQPGPQLGAVLRDLRAWWLAGGCHADTRDCARELAARLAR